MAGARIVWPSLGAAAYVLLRAAFFLTFNPDEYLPKRVVGAPAGKDALGISTSTGEGMQEALAPVFRVTPTHAFQERPMTFPALRLRHLDRTLQGLGDFVGIVWVDD
jgi:hypothetical protein